jgi:hypothetical protein
MIRAILRFVQWLDSRFPAKVEITRENWYEMQSQHLYQRERISELRRDLEATRAEMSAWGIDGAKTKEAVSAIKDLLAKNGNLVVKSDASKLRDEFVSNPERFRFINGKEEVKP